MFKPLIACFLLWVFFQATLTDKARVKIRIVKEVSVNRQLISAICGKYPNDGRDVRFERHQSWGIFRQIKLTN